MLAISASTRILVGIEPVDFRKGIDGLAQLCRSALSSEPFSGTVFVFRNRRGTAIKVLAYDGQGFWLCQKRLSRGRFQWWPEPGSEAARSLDARELQLILFNGDPEAAGMQPHWRPVVA